MTGMPNLDTKNYSVAILVKSKKQKTGVIILFYDNFAFYISRTYFDQILNSKYSFSVKLRAFFETYAHII